MFHDDRGSQAGSDLAAGARNQRMLAGGVLVPTQPSSRSDVTLAATAIGDATASNSPPATPEDASNSRRGKRKKRRTNPNDNTELDDEHHL